MPRNARPTGSPSSPHTSHPPSDIINANVSSSTDFGHHRSNATAATQTAANSRNESISPVEEENAEISASTPTKKATLSWSVSIRPMVDRA